MLDRDAKMTEKENILIAIGATKIIPPVINLAYHVVDFDLDIDTTRSTLIEVVTESFDRMVKQAIQAKPDLPNAH